MKIAIYQRKPRHRISAGGGSRTLTLFRAMAPKAIAYAISPRPRVSDRTAAIGNELSTWDLTGVAAVYRKAVVARLGEFVGPKS
jgi:hypothetical protein